MASALQTIDNGYGTNDWTIRKIKDLQALQKTLPDAKITPVSAFVEKATWGVPDKDGNRTAYFSSKKDVVRCAETFKWAYFVVNELGFAEEVSPLLPIKKGHYGNRLPNLFSITVEEEKLKYFFKNVEWSKIPSTDSNTVCKTRMDTRWPC